MTTVATTWSDSISGPPSLPRWVVVHACCGRSASDPRPPALLHVTSGAPASPTSCLQDRDSMSWRLLAWQPPGGRRRVAVCARHERSLRDSRTSPMPRMRDPLTGLLNRRGFEEPSTSSSSARGGTDQPCSAWSSATSTASRRSTTPSVTARATRALRHGRRLISSAKRRCDSRPGWGARSSRWCSPTPTSTAPTCWPSACAAPPSGFERATRAAHGRFGVASPLPRRRPRRAAPGGRPAPCTPPSAWAATAR